jgi:hypothetical protein
MASSAVLVLGCLGAFAALLLGGFSLFGVGHYLAKAARRRREEMDQRLERRMDNGDVG